MVDNVYLNYNYNATQEILSEKNREIANRFLALKDYDIIDNITKGKEEYYDLCNLIIAALRWIKLDTLVGNYKELISLFLVENAKYNYNNQEGGFWSGIEKIVKNFSINDRKTIVNSFELTIKKYGLSDFSTVKDEGYKLISPIICHAGIPLNNLDSFLDAINTMYGVNYSHIEAEIDYACRYADKPVKRYISFLMEKGVLEDQILRFFDVVSCIKNNRNLDNVLDLSEDIKEIAIQWVEKKTNQTQYQSHFNCPELFLDTELLKIKIKLPQLVLSDSKYVLWEIKDGEIEYKKKAYGREVNGKYYYQEFFYPINNANGIVVTLIDDRGLELQNFILRKTDDISLFDKDGQFNKSRFISKKGSYFLCNEEYDVINAELLSSECSGLYIYTSIQNCEDEIIFRKENYQKIYTIKEKPYLLYGKKAFDERATFSFVDAYTVLPYMILPNNKKWTITIKNETNEKVFEVEGVDEIGLESYIMNGFLNPFGLFKIRLQNDLQGYSSLSFVYVPKCNIKMGSIYPTGQGYNETKILFDYDTKITIVDQSNITIDNQVWISKIENELEGKILFNNLVIPFEICLKAFTWTIFGDDEMYGEANKTSYISVKDIKLNTMIILNLTNNTSQNYKVLIDCGKKYCKLLSFYANRTLVINLNEFSEYFLLNEDDEAEIRIIVRDNCFLPICKIKQELCVTNFNGKFDPKNNMLDFYWSEDGPKTGRVFVLYNLNRPYIKQEIPINDKEAEIKVNRSLFMEDTVVEIKKEQISNNIYMSYTTKIVLPIQENIKFVNSKRDGNLLHLDNISFENVVYSYLFHSIPKISGKLEKEGRIFLCKSEIEKIVEYRNRFGDENLYSILNKFDLSIEDYERISNDLSLYIPIYKGGILEQDIIERLKKGNILSYLFYIISINGKKNLESFNITLENMKDSKCWEIEKDSIIFPKWYEKKDFDKSVREYISQAHLPSKEAIAKALITDALFETNKRVLICENPEYNKAITYLVKNYSKTFLNMIIKFRR